MPTTNKRVNLTIPDVIYTRLQVYKEKNGISSDAAACLQLIKQQLNGIEQTEKMLDLMKHIPMEELKSLSNIGLEAIKQATNKGLPQSVENE